MTDPCAAGNPRLLETIRQEIRDHGPISFARFMELALYDPRDGYYAHRADRIGPDGDFYTASDAGHAFGRCLARQIAEIDRIVGPARPFRVVEFGAGRGLLARDVIDALRPAATDLSARFDYTIVDRSVAMREEAARRVPESHVTGAEALAPGGLGVVVAVELFDALPVRRVRRDGATLFELVVDADSRGTLVERRRPASPKLAALAADWGAAAADGSEAEIVEDLEAQLALLSGALHRGVILIVDYGDSAPRLYDPTIRPRGTLLAYRGHRTSEDYLEHVGEQDLTAHVNFTALEEAATRLGLTVLGRTTQDRFLVANGILDEFEQDDLARARDPAAVKRRMQALSLIHPQAMGRRFQVLVLAKGCEPDLSGLRDPFARSS